MNDEPEDTLIAERSAFVESWAAIILDSPEGASRRFGDCAEESIIPAGQRRRLGRFGRMAVSCGLSVAGSDISDLVFCSRYGDVDLAYRLLQDLVSGGLLSPAGFSLSVHNAVPGVMDILRQSRVGHAAVAGGTQSLSAGIVEAWGKLVAHPDNKVTLVFAECGLPEDFSPFSSMDNAGVALAVTLSLCKRPRSFGRFCSGVMTDLPTCLDAPDSELLAQRLIVALDGADDDGHSAISWRSRGLDWSFIAGSDAVA